MKRIGCGLRVNLLVEEAMQRAYVSTEKSVAGDLKRLTPHILDSRPSSADLQSDACKYAFGTVWKLPDSGNKDEHARTAEHKVYYATMQAIDFLVKKLAAQSSNNVENEATEQTLLRYVTEKIPCTGKLKLDKVEARHCISTFAEFAGIFETYHTIRKHLKMPRTRSLSYRPAT
jgi:hypothetical protein